MAVLSSRDLRVAEAIGAIGYCNPFLPERLALERSALGAAFQCADPVINLPPDSDLKAIFPKLYSTARTSRVSVGEDAIKGARRVC